METAAKLKVTGQFGQLVRVVRFIAPAVVTVLIGWGTVQFTNGRNSSRLDNVEEGLKQTLTLREFKTWTDELRETLRLTNQKADNLVTREQFEQFKEQNRDQLTDLKEDLRIIIRRK